MLETDAEAAAAVAAEEERILLVADPPPPPAPALGGRPRADRAGVRAMAVDDDDDDAPVRSSVMVWDDATSADAAAALVLPVPALADLPALSDDDDETALPVFSLSGGG